MRGSSVAERATPAALAAVIVAQDQHDQFVKVILRAYTLATDLPESFSLPSVSVEVPAQRYRHRVSLRECPRPGDTIAANVPPVNGLALQPSNESPDPANNAGAGLSERK
jgi:hypothetical protein